MGEGIKLPAGKDLAGFETYRYLFWGTEIMTSLGLKLLPTLKDGAWLVLADNQLDDIEQEAEIIRQNVDLLVQHTLLDEEHILFYAKNIIDAVKIAKDINGYFHLG